jgi:hypothetical protein
MLGIVAMSGGPEPAEGGSMHRSEMADLVVCSDCGAEISLSAGRVFTFGTSGALCWECAERRGGSYDATHERWSSPPSISDLEEEES